MRRNLTVGIAGCGIGGMAAGLMLSRAGHDVTIIDQFETPAPIGSGLVIQPVGQDVLRALNVYDRVEASGHKIYKMFGTESASDRTVLNVDYGPVSGVTYGLGIHRASLFDALYTAVKQSDIALMGGKTICGTDRVGVRRTLRCEGGEVFGPFDLVIDASGAGSRLTPINARKLSYGALWGTVRWPADTTLPIGQLTQCYRKAHHMLGVLPIGYLPGATDAVAAIFWSEPRADLDAWFGGDLDAWKAHTVDLWPEFAPFVTQIKRHSDMTAARYSHGTLMRPFDDAIAYIGDSAHQASPQLGQGANMALLDARALTDALAEYDDIGLALGQYAAARRYHVGLYQLFSAVFTPFYQSSSRILPALRDNVMNPLSQIWPLKPMLTKLVCGTLVQP